MLHFKKKKQKLFKTVKKINFFGVLSFLLMCLYVFKPSLIGFP